MTVAYFSGFETGGSGEVSTFGAGASIQSTTVRTGGYALKEASSITIFRTGLAATQSVLRFYLRFPTAAAAPNIVAERISGGTNRLQLNLTSGRQINAFDGGTLGALSNVLGSAVLAVDTWYRIEVALDLAAGGAIKTWINGALDINGSHASDVSATPTDAWGIRGVANPDEYFFDDVRIDTGTLTPPGPGQCIARQGKAGTPTYDAWTKTGAATAALCWSDTPFATGTNCSSSTSAAAQTMLVAPFSQVQAGHGSEVVSPIDVIGACKAAVIAKRATSGNPSIRRRIGGADTDTAETVTTTDAYYDDGIWTTTPANLDTAEIGMVKAADGNLTTVEDAWLMVDYQPVWFPHRGDLCFEEPIIRPRVEMVAY